MKKAGHAHTRTRKSRQKFGKNRDFVPIGLKLFDLEANIYFFRFVCTPMQFCVWENRDFVPICLNLLDLEENINIFRFVCTPMQICVWEKSYLLA